MRRTPLLCLCLVLLAGCSSDARTFNPITVSGIPHPDTTLRWGVVGVSDVPTLDPALVSDPTSISVASLVYGGLVRFNSALRVVPDGASHWTISRDGKVYTFSLRPNLRFADGRRVTAQDFVWALTRALGPEASASAAPFYLQLIKSPQASPAHGGGIVAVNRSTLRITLVHPAAHFLSELAFPSSYVPDPTLPARYGDSWTDHAAGFGPYSVLVWRHSRYLTLVRNPHYYGDSTGLRKITLRFYSESRALTAYRDGQLDVVSGLPPGEAFSSRPPGVRRASAMALDYLAFNTTRLPFKRLNARRAFASVIRPELTAATMGSTTVASRGIVPSSLGINVPLWRPAASTSVYLTRAKYPRGRGFPPVVLVTPQDPHLFALALALKHAWYRSLHIDVIVRQLNSSDYQNVLDARVFDLALVRWGGDYPDPQDFLGTQLGPSPYNVTGWSKPAYDAGVALADSYSPLDPRRISILQRAASLATRSLPLVPLDEPAVTAIVRSDLRGVSLTPLGSVEIRPAEARFTG